MKRATKDGKWWEASPEDALTPYTQYLEETVDALEEKIAEMMSTSESTLAESKVIVEFFRCSKEALAPDEFVFLCLKLAGFRYAFISSMITSLSMSRSSIHRKVKRAENKLRQRVFLKKESSE